MLRLHSLIRMAHIGVIQFYKPRLHPILWILLVAACILHLSTGTDRHPSKRSAAPCINNLIKKSRSDITRRFGKPSMASYCDKMTNWESRSRKPRPLFDNPLSSHQQKMWLWHLRTCVTPNQCLSSVKHRTKRYSRSVRPAIRKEYRRLTDRERERFHRAINMLKSDMIEGRSKYDILNIYHTPEEAPGAHWGPALLPWHRELLKQLEVAMRSYDPDVAVPYWDSTLEEGLPEPRDSIIWTGMFFGEAVGDVTTGAFGNWTAFYPLSPAGRIRRNVGGKSYGSPFYPEDITDIMGRERFEDLTACVDPFLELVHGDVHTWVGGHMDVPEHSVDDPTFFMHHAFVDHIWERFRREVQGINKSELEYPEDGRSCNKFHYGSALMLPFPLRNKGGLTHGYTRYFYDYEPAPSCSSNNPSCGSAYIFCDRMTFRCRSKVRIGGNCTGFEHTDICYGSTCQNGICRTHVSKKLSTNAASPGNNAINAPVVNLLNEVTPGVTDTPPTHNKSVFPTPSPLSKHQNDTTAKTTAANASSIAMIKSKISSPEDSAGTIKRFAEKANAVKIT